MEWDVFTKSNFLHTVSHSLARLLNIRTLQHKKGNLLSDSSSDKLLSTTIKLKLNGFLRSKPYL